MPDKPEPPPAQSSVPRHWLLIYRLLALTFLCVVVGFSVTPLVKSFTNPLYNKDYTIWQKYGQLGIKGQPLYPHDPATEVFEFMYPPVSAVVLYGPFSLLPTPLFVLVLALLNSAAWLFCIFGAVYLATGRWKNQEPLLYLLPALLCAGYAWDTYLLGQINIVLLALVLGAAILIKNGRPVVGGGLIALAASIKAFPVLLLGWLVWRRQWRALAGFAGVCLILVTISAGVRGVDQTRKDFDAWSIGMLSKEGSQEIGQRSGIAFTYKNQSLKSVVHRLTRPVEAGDDQGVHYAVNLINLSPDQSQKLFILVLGLLGLAFMACTLPHPRPGGSWLSPEPAQNITGWEIAMVLNLNVMASPMAWTYFYIWLLPSLTCLTHAWLSYPHGSPRRLGYAALLIIIGAILISAVTQAWDEHRPAAYGVTFFGALLLMLISGFSIRSLRRTEPDPVQHPSAQHS